MVYYKIGMKIRENWQCELSQKQNQTEHVQNVKEEDQEHKIYVFRVVHSNVPLWIRGEPYLCKYN